MSCIRVIYMAWCIVSIIIIIVCYLKRQLHQVYFKSPCVIILCTM